MIYIYIYIYKYTCNIYTYILYMYKIYTQMCTETYMHKNVLVCVFTDCISSTKHYLGIACFKDLFYMRRSILNRANEKIHSILIVV